MKPKHILTTLLATVASACQLSYENRDVPVETEDPLVVDVWKYEAGSSDCNLHSYLDYRNEVEIELAQVGSNISTRAFTIRAFDELKGDDSIRVAKNRPNASLFHQAAQTKTELPYSLSTGNSNIIHVKKVIPGISSDEYKADIYYYHNENKQIIEHNVGSDAPSYMRFTRSLDALSPVEQKEYAALRARAYGNN